MGLLSACAKAAHPPRLSNPLQAEVMGIVQDLAIKSAHKPHPNYTTAPRHFGECLGARTPTP